MLLSLNHDAFYEKNSLKVLKKFLFNAKDRGYIATYS